MKTVFNALFILSIFSFIFSCRHIPNNEEMDSENISLSEPKSVKIKFLGVEYQKNDPNNTLISENATEGGGEDYLNNNKLAENIYYGDFISTKVETIPEIPENNKYLASLGLEAAKKSAGNLPTDAVYTILAYTKVGRGCTFYKKYNFSVNQLNSEIKLDYKKAYVIIILSTGTKEFPNIANENNYSDVRFNIENHSDPNVKFLYQTIENFTPKLNNVINIKLRGSTGISIVIDTRGIPGVDGARITKLENVSIKYNKSKAIKLGNISDIGYKEVTLLPKNQGFIDNEHMLYRIDFHDLIFAGSYRTIRLFIGTIRIDGHPSMNSINNLPLGPASRGHKYTYILRTLPCGAYLGPNKTNFREFMCHNLDKKISEITTRLTTRHGDLYSWGSKTTVPNFWSWNDYLTRKYEQGNVWTESENPCPKGFRVPSLDEWKNLLNPNHNSIKRTYFNGSISDHINYITIGYSEINLFHNSYYWTSTAKDAENAYFYYISSNSSSLGTGTKVYGQYIRCIKKLLNEE